MLRCDVQCAYLFLDTRLAVEQAIDQMYMKTSTLYHLQYVSSSRAVFSKDGLASCHILLSQVFGLPTFAKGLSAVMEIVSTASWFATSFRD